MKQLYTSFLEADCKIKAENFGKENGELLKSYQEACCKCLYVYRAFGGRERRSCALA